LLRRGKGLPAAWITRTLDFAKEVQGRGSGSHSPKKRRGLAAGEGNRTLLCSLGSSTVINQNKSLAASPESGAKADQIFSEPRGLALADGARCAGFAGLARAQGHST